MNSARKLLVNGAKLATVSLRSNHLEPAGRSVAPANLSDPILEKIRDRKDGSRSAIIPQAHPPGDGNVQADNKLIQDGQPVTKKLSEVVRTLCRTPEREKRIDLLAVMRQEARALRETLSAANFKALADLTSALERLFKALGKDVGAVNGSTLKTISHAIDFLTQATSSNSGHDEMDRTPIRMLAVDDDPVCLRTLMMLASHNNGISLVSCDGAEPALCQLKTGDFEMIFSDILMPGMNGFEFVAEARKLPRHRTTPVVFVTALSDFETRSRSVLSGGCDLIAKPFTAGEVLVKALTLGLKRRFDSAAAVAEAERQPQDVSPNGAAKDSELPSPNNGRNGHGTLKPERSTLKGLAARGVIVVEEHGSIRSINMAAAELLGYNLDEAANGDVRALFPDELQSEENKTLLSQVIAGTVKSKTGLNMTGRRKDDSTVQLLVSVAEMWAGRQRSIMCLLQPSSPPVAAKEEVRASAVDAKSAPAELTSPIEPRNTTLTELIRTKEYWEACANERAALLEDLRNRLRGQDSAVEDLRQESETFKGLLERQTKEHLERQSELKELIRAKEYWEGCASERAAMLEEQKSRLRGQEGAVEDLRRESEALKGFCKARVAELQQTRTLLERQAKEHLERQSELQCKCATIQAQVGKSESALQAEVGQRGNWERRATELEQARVALQGEIREWEQREGQLKSECARLEQQSQGLTVSLSQMQTLLAKEAAGRMAAELRANELAELRKAQDQELAQRMEAEEKLQSLLQTKRARLEATNGNLSAQQSHLEATTRELQAVQAALAERAQQERQLTAECARLEQELRTVAASLAQTQTQLAAETEHRTAAESRANELAELRNALEQELAQRKQSEEKLQGELQERQAQLQTTKDSLSAQTSQLEARTRELQAAQAALAERAQQERQLTAECARLEQESRAVAELLAQTQTQLAAETEHRTAAQEQAGELEQELAQHKQTEEKLQSELSEKQAQLETTKDGLSVQQSQLEATTRELQAAQAALAKRAQQKRQLTAECVRLEQELRAVAESLAQTRAQFTAEADHRTAAESRSNELAELRKALEQELAQRQETEEKLLSRLQTKRARLEAANGSLSAQQNQLEARTRELQAAQAALAERAQQERQLTTECARLEQELQAAAESLAQTRAQMAAETEHRAAAQQQAGELAELRSVLEQELATSREREENLRAGLKAAEADVAGQAKNRTALGQELGQAQAKVGELGSRVSELESQLRAEVAQRGDWERRATELQQARVALAGEIRDWAEREGQLKSECARLEQQGQGMTESLIQTQSLLAEEVAGRTAARQQAAELAGLRNALEQELAASGEREEDLQAELKAAKGAVAVLEKNRTALGQELDKAQATVGELGSRVSELERALRAEVTQRGDWERRAAELEQARLALAGETRKWAEREGQLKSECARLEQQGQGMTESLIQTQSLLAKEAAGRTAAEQQAGELAGLRKVLEQELAASGEREENLQAELKAAKGAVAVLEKNRTALGQELDQAQTTVGELGSRVSELERALRAEVTQRGDWERRAAELEQARLALAGETRKWAEREGQLKSECARLEQQGQGMTESLIQTQSLLAKEAAGRTAAEQQAGELAGLRKVLEQELAASGEREENLQAELKAAKGAVAVLEKNRTALGQELDQAQATVGELGSRVSELERALRAEVTQRGDWERRAAELEQARLALAGEIREWAEREGQLKSECARLEQQGQGMTESLIQTQALLAKEAAGRTAAEQQASELAGLRKVLEQELAASREREQNLRAGLKAAEGEVARLEKNRTALSQELGQARQEVGELGSRVGELKSTLRAEVAQRGDWQRRATELEQARLAQAEEIREWAEREGQLKSECARLEQQGQGLTESLIQTQALLAKEAAGRTAAEQQAGESVGLRKALELELGANRDQKEKLQAELKAAETAVAGLEKNRTALGQELDQAQAKVGELGSRAGELESQLKDQINQAQAWEQRDAETNRARALLEFEIRQHVEREDGLKAKCTAFELHLARINESLAQTRDERAEEEASRLAAEGRVEELSQLQIAAGRELAERARREKQLLQKLEEGAKRLSDCEASLSAVESLVEDKTRSLQSAEARVAVLAEKESRLERELVLSQKTSQSLEAKANALAVTQRAVAEELVELRGQAARHARSEQQLRQEIEVKVIELQRCKEELTRVLQVAHEREEVRQKTINALESQFKEGLAKLTAL